MLTHPFLAERLGFLEADFQLTCIAYYAMVILAYEFTPPNLLPHWRCFGVYIQGSRHVVIADILLS